MFQKDQDITHEAVTKKLQEIIAVRGKKGTKRGDQVCSFSSNLRIKAVSISCDGLQWNKFEFVDPIIIRALVLLTFCIKFFSD